MAILDAAAKVAATKHEPPKQIEKASPKDAYEVGYSAAIFGIIKVGKETK